MALNNLAEKAKCNLAGKVATGACDWPSACVCAHAASVHILAWWGQCSLAGVWRGHSTPCLEPCSPAFALQHPARSAIPQHHTHTSPCPPLLPHPDPQRLLLRAHQAQWLCCQGLPQHHQEQRERVLGSSPHSCRGERPRQASLCRVPMHARHARGLCREREHDHRIHLRQHAVSGPVHGVCDGDCGGQGRLLLCQRRHRCQYLG